MNQLIFFYWKLMTSSIFEAKPPSLVCIIGKNTSRYLKMQISYFLKPIFNVFFLLRISSQDEINSLGMQIAYYPNEILKGPCSVDNDYCNNKSKFCFKSSFFSNRLKNASSQTEHICIYVVSNHKYLWVHHFSVASIHPSIHPFSLLYKRPPN